MPQLRLLPTLQGVINLRRKERPWQGPLFLLLGPKIPRYVIIHPSMLRLRLRGLEDPFLVGQVSHGAFTPLKLAAEYTRVISPLSIPF